MTKEALRLSRSKIDLFLQCPRCFYLDLRLGVPRPRMPGFTLNVAVDHLLKKEFDVHRAAGTIHPLLKEYGVKAVPFSHPEFEIWRQNFKGIQYLHKPTGFLVTGAVDDIWKNDEGELIVVDYKATAKAGRVESLEDTKWNEQYKRQLEVYQWLLRQNGFPVSDTGYFVYVNGRKDKEAFDARLEFDVTLISHKGSDAWVSKALASIRQCLDDGRIPKQAEDCDHCNYVAALGRALRKNVRENK